MDLNAGRRMCPPNAPDEVLIVALHRARYEHPGVRRHLRIESEIWLRLRKLPWRENLPIYPFGILPHDPATAPKTVPR